MSVRRKNFTVSFFALLALLMFSCVSVNAQKIIEGGVLNGKAISLPKPAYPEIAKAARASGTVVVQVTIDEDGNVISATAVSGHPLLKAAAVQAAYGAKFSPTTLSGQPIKVTGKIVYNFVLPMNWTDIGYELTNAHLLPKKTYLLSSSIASSLPVGYELERDALNELNRNDETTNFENRAQQISNIINSIQSKLVGNPKNSWYFSVGVALAKIYNQIDSEMELRQDLESINQLNLNAPSDVSSEIKEAMKKLASRAYTKAQAEENKNVIDTLIRQILSAGRRVEKAAN
jgi:TonB family protein